MSRYRKLEAWLEANNFQEITAWRAEGLGAMLALGRIGNGIALVIWYDHHEAWEILTGPDTVDMAATFADAERRLGIATPPGTPAALKAYKPDPAGGDGS